MSTQNTPVYAWDAPVLSGLGISYLTATTMSVAAGECSSSEGTNVFTLSSAVTINAANNGAAGLDTGDLANSTFYAVYAIADSSLHEDPSAILSANVSAPLLPFNYDMYRRIGYVLTDGSANIRNFVQTGNGSSRKMWYDAAISVLSGGTSATYANVNLVTAVPGSSVVEVMLKATVTPTAAADAVNFVPYGSTATVGYAVVSGAVAAVAITSVVTLPCGLNSSVPYVLYKVTGAASASVQGYVDLL